MAKEHMLQANMDQNQNGQPGGGNAHGKNQIVAPQTGSGGSAFSAYPARREEQQQQQQHYSPTFIHHHLKQQDLQQALDKFWETQLKEIEETDPSEMFKSHCLPLARIKKIMKADEDVRMISAEAPVLFAKACEMFIMELTMRAWVNAEENKRRTLQKSDIASAVSGTDVFDFLVDVVPRDDTMEHEVFVGIPKQEPVAGNNNVTYYVPMPPVPNYHHQHHAAAAGGGGGAGPSSSYGAPLGRPMFDHARYRQHHPRAFGTHVLPIPRLQRNHSPNSDDSDNDD